MPFLSIGPSAHPVIMVMDTVKINILQGIVQGVVESGFQKLSEKISPVLQNVWWDKDRLFVSNRGSEQFFGDYHKLEKAFDEIAGVVTSGQHGKLGRIGLMGKEGPGTSPDPSLFKRASLYPV